MLQFLRKPDTPFLSSKFTLHIVPLPTYQYRLPDTTYSPTSYTTILFYHYPPAYYVTTTAAGSGGLNVFIEAPKAKAKKGSLLTFPEIWVQG